MLTRRSFTQLIGSTTAAGWLDTRIRGAAAVTQPAPLPGRPGPVFARAADDGLHFGNDLLELVLDQRDGHFLQLRNRRAGVDHLSANHGVWPFGLTVGSRDEPEALTAEIRAGSPQTMSWKVESGPRGMHRLRLTYSMLRDNRSGHETGVGLGVSIELAPERNYLILRAEIANGGPHGVTRFYAGQGTVVTGEPARAGETVWLPTRGGHSHPKFQPTHIGLPTYCWGWADYSGARSGIGMGYVNQQGIQLMFDLDPTPEGLIQGWHLFDTRGYWHFENMMNAEQKRLLLQPLEAGNNFTTDEWLIVLHEGDWHRTADAYRERYLEAFRNDYVDWEGLPARTRQQDVRLGCWVAENSIGNHYPRLVLMPLREIAPQVKEALRTCGIPPERASMNVTFFHPHVGRYPEFFPVFPAAGGEEGWKEMLAQLRPLGLAGLTGYTHLAYDHPAASNYVVEADALDTTVTINPTAGHRACVDNSAWQALWRERLIPAYRAHGFQGVFADEGHFPWGTCSVAGKAHTHGTSAVGILTANTRGILGLHRLLHDGLGPGSSIMVEGSGDVAGRWADENQAYPDPAVAYTLPFRRYFWGVDATTPQADLDTIVNLCLAHGYALEFSLHRGQPLRGAPTIRRYIRWCQRLRRQPGYPQHFRDSVGVTGGADGLVVKAFSGPAGITVVYYATEAVQAQLEIDGTRLNHPHLGRQPLRIHLGQGEIGFHAWPV